MRVEHFRLLLETATACLLRPLAAVYLLGKLLPGGKGRHKTESVRAAIAYTDLLLEGLAKARFGPSHIPRAVQPPPPPRNRTPDDSTA